MSSDALKIVYKSVVLKEFLFLEFFGGAGQATACRPTLLPPCGALQPRLTKSWSNRLYDLE